MGLQNFQPQIVIDGFLTLLGVGVVALVVFFGYYLFHRYIISKW